MIAMKKYLEETVKTQLKEFRLYESSIERKWGGRKRLFKCVDAQLEIKFCKALMLFDDSLVNGDLQKKAEMIEMMNRAYSALIEKAEANGFSELEDNHRCYKYRDNKIAIVCDTEFERPRLKELYGSDKDTVLFSVEELFRFIHPDYIEAKEAFKKRNIDITFKKVSYT